WKTKSTASRVW
ncbi:ribose 5-phosphate isomerase A, partial [Vibrio parahaemolyticus AQ3810]